MRLHLSLEKFLRYGVEWQIILQQGTKLLFDLLKIRLVHPKRIVGVKCNNF